MTDPKTRIETGSKAQAGHGHGQTHTTGVLAWHTPDEPRTAEGDDFSNEHDGACSCADCAEAYHRETIQRSEPRSVAECMTCVEEDAACFTGEDVAWHRSKGHDVRTVGRKG